MGKRGRKKGADGKVSRALLLEIAVDEFSRNGYHGTKISSIVERAKLTQPTFYLYFDSKEAIFQELVDLFQEKLFSLTKEARLDSGLDINTLPERISHGLEKTFDFFAENKSLTQIGFYNSTEAAAIKNQMVLLMVENLQTEVENGYFNPNLDIFLVAECIVGMMERVTITKLFQGEKSPEQLAKEIVALLFYGMRALDDN